MLIQKPDNNILDQWDDTEINHQRLKKWGYKIYIGNTETGYDGKIYISGTAPTPPELTYSEKRLAAYPPISEQLDMLYWDKINNTDQWKDAVTAVKEQFPKP